MARRFPEKIARRPAYSLNLQLAAKLLELGINAEEIVRHNKGIVNLTRAQHSRALTDRVALSVPRSFRLLREPAHAFEINSRWIPKAAREIYFPDGKNRRRSSPHDYAVQLRHPVKNNRN